MELHYSQTSPFARKTRIVLREKGLAAFVAEVLEAPMLDSPQFLALNPLGKIPVLSTPDGAIYDSPVICEYLDALGSGPSLLGNTPQERMRIIRVQALADGIMDAGVASVLEKRRDDTVPSAHWLARWSNAMRRGVDALADIRLDHSFDLAGIATFCALAYLDFRFPELEWRQSHPELAQTCDMFSTKASCRETAYKLTLNQYHAS